MIGLVLRASGWEALVDTDGQQRLCQLRGRVKAGRRKAVSAVVAGDRVEVQPTESGRGVIETVLPRKSSLSRVASGTRPVRQVLAANLDLFIIVVATRDPQLQPTFIDRGLVMALSGGIEGIAICINKTDLDAADERRPVVTLYRDLGYQVLEVSAETGVGMPALVDAFHQGLSVLIGPSGVGKSSILNAVEPGLGLRTQELMRHHDRGRHTTAVVGLHQLTGGGYVADSPGLKQLQPWGVTEGELVDYFPEMAPLTPGCQFRDCSHMHEPGCAIREAVEEGRIAATRYEGFRRIHADAVVEGRHP